MAAPHIFGKNAEIKVAVFLTNVYNIHNMGKEVSKWILL